MNGTELESLEEENLMNEKRIWIIIPYDCSIAISAIVINIFALAATSRSTFRLYGYRAFIISVICGDIYIVSKTLSHEKRNTIL